MTLTSSPDGEPRQGSARGPGPRDPTEVTLGVSAGTGLVHCVLVTVDDHDRLTVDARVITVDPGDRLSRADRVNSGVDLMLDRAASLDLTVTAVGICVRPDDSSIEARGSGPRRRIHLVSEADAVAQALAADDAMAAYDEMIVADCGDSGVSIYRIGVRRGDVGAATRSTTLSGNGVDVALAKYVQEHATDVGGVRRSDLVSACHTAKEEVTEGDSTTVSFPGGRCVIPATTVRSIVTPAVSATVDAIADHRRRHDVSVDAPIALVGGLAQMPAIRAAFAGASTVEVVTPRRPELACAIGAALAVRHSRARRAAVVIGGGRHRDWLSTAPLALAGALLAAATVTVVAVSVAVDDTSASRTTTPTVPTTVTRSPVGAVAASASGRSAEPTAAPPIATTSAPVARDEDELPARTTYPAPAYPDDDSRDGPVRGWATTELTTTTGASVPTSTLSPETTTPPSSGGQNPSGSPSNIPPDTRSTSPAPDRSDPDSPRASLTPYPLLPTTPSR